MRVQTQQPNKFTEGLKSDQQSIPKPPWLKIRPPTTDKFAQIKALLKEKKLNTVCAEAHCPNISECWSGGTATFMLMGDTCTRACRFCMVKSGNPRGILDEQEPQKLVDSVKIMGLEYIVLTCVTRDDLADGGASHFARCVNELKKNYPALLVEVLISDLNDQDESIQKIIDAKPAVFAHNVETIERLQSAIRDPRANYKKSLSVLEKAKKLDPPPRRGGATTNRIYTKTSLMLGLGETEEEVIQTMKDLRAIQVDVVTFGQYLRPSPFHVAVHEYVTPGQFKKYEIIAKELGFLYCAAGPFVRSSYRAGELFMKNIILKGSDRRAA
jgi:lipoic acid synthetase